MMRIGLLSDTHGWLDPQLTEVFADCDELWHAGDLGQLAVADALLATGKPLLAVYGNIDDLSIRQRYPLDLIFEREGIRVLMTHIGGYPGRYTARLKKLLDEHRPDLYVCGHSHILKVVPDQGRQLLHINPGACGREGFHRVRTAVRFTLVEGKISALEVVELGARASIG